MRRQRLAWPSGVGAIILLACLLHACSTRPTSPSDAGDDAGGPDAQVDAGPGIDAGPCAHVGTSLADGGCLECFPACSDAGCGPGLFCDGGGYCVCGLARGPTQLCCAMSGAPCSQGLECCSGICAGGSCSASGTRLPCFVDDDCAVGICYHDEFCCAPTGAACRSDFECCGGQCSVNPQADAGGEGVCLCALANTSGAFCRTDADCCPGSQCSEYMCDLNRYATCY